jgi:predicted nicotinamide N-methyase
LSQDSKNATDYTIDHIKVGDGVFAFARPSNVESMIESGQGLDQLGDGIRMPYWASLWPVSRALAAKILQDPENFRNKKTIELGCGLGLAGLAALRCGASMTFSDYDDEALNFAARNAQLNGFTGAATLKLDWKNPLPLSFDLIIGSDLAWSPEIVPFLVNTMGVLLSKSGRIWLADQNRLERSSFQKLLQSSKLEIVRCEMLTLDESWGWNIEGTFYEIKRSDI